MSMANVPLNLLECINLLNLLYIFLPIIFSEMKIVSSLPLLSFKLIIVQIV